MYHNIPIHIFVIGDVAIGKKKFKIINNKNLSSNLTKMKALIMASTCNIPFNIDSQTIHSTLNILVKKSIKFTIRLYK
jgi:UDP-N-acetylglucosamine pyrophosphorylase